MLRLNPRLIVVAAVLCLASAAGAQAPPPCPTSFSAPISVANDTNGSYFPPNTIVTVSVTSGGGTATAVSWNLVGDPSGTPVYSGPHGLGDSVTYTTTGFGQGVGYYVLATNGTAVGTISCVPGAAVNVPATSHAGLAALAVMLAALALVSLRVAQVRRKDR
ncbi:MAG: hypothetical protein JSR18_02930 [Proteobacteria bacterium]|nr:hypothetical protein [Pseudomonadota bacterium]